MIDEKFSSETFARLGLDTDESRKLADVLQQEVNEEMRRIIEPAFERIVAKLNSLGHNLKLELEKANGEISFRDEYNDANGYHCKLRLGFDYVTSAGYADVIDDLGG